LKTILITGGTGFLGEVLVRHFHGLSMNVLFTSTSREKITSLENSLTDHALVKGYITDFNETDAPEKLVQAIRFDGHLVNHLVNNARSLENLTSDNQGVVSAEQFASELMINVIAPYRLVSSLSDSYGQYLQTVVNIGSQYGLVAHNPNLYSEGRDSGVPIHYGVAKAAVSHLTKELAVKLALKNTRVNCVAFGGFSGRATSDFIERYSELSPMGRMLEKSEVTGPVEFLTLEGSSSITGTTLVADGGWSLW
jgi:NAD(P)-dependent dehydrogenase (short-subunit alcohol dehydrogenase family)